MKYIRKPRRPDNLRSESRVRKRGRVGKYVYLALLAGVALWILDLTAGQFFYLKAEGMVTREATAIAAEHVARVVALDVSEGAQIKRGGTIAHLDSQEIADLTAKLTSQLVQSQMALSEMKIRNARVVAMLPAAQRRAEAAEQERRKVEKFDQIGMITLTQRARVMDDAYGSLRDLRDLQQEENAAAAQIPELEGSVRRARQSLDQLRAAYGDGVLISPVDGTVSDLRVQLGAVVRPGEEMMRIYHGETYVLAYVPTGTLYSIKPGDEVRVRTGFQVLRGKVQSLLPIASQLPQEFQKAFQSAKREQLARIEIEAGQHLPPLFSTVEVGWGLNPTSVLSHFLEG